MNYKKRLLTCIITGSFAVSTIAIGNLASAEDVPNTSKEVKILSVGDSITDGYWEQGSYRKYMYKLLSDDGYSIDMVGTKGMDTQTTDGFTYDGDYCGYSGYAIQDISGTETRSGIYEVLTNGNVMETYSPDIVLLQIGTNDVLSAYNEGIEDRLENLVDYILTYLQDDDDMLFVTSIPDIDVEEVYTWFWAYGDVYYNSSVEEFTKLVGDYIDSYNAKIKELVQKEQAQGKHIQYADINSVVDASTDLYDGVHPNEIGYQKMGEYWYTMVDTYLSGNTSNHAYYDANGNDITNQILSGTYSFTDDSIKIVKDGTPVDTTTTEVTTTTETPTETTTEETSTTTETPTETTTEETSTTTETPTETTTEETSTTTETPTETTTEETSTTTETPTETTTTIEPSNEPITGDVNLDGKVTTADLLSMKKYLLSINTLSEEQLKAGDINHDGNVKTNDLLMLKKYLLGIVSSLD